MLHVKYLGTDMYFLASVLWLLCYRILPGTAESNLTLVWKGVNAYYALNPSADRYTQMKLSMFVKPDSPNTKFPKLKGKGAEIRALVPAMHAVWCQYMSRGDTQHAQIKTALECSVAMDRIIQSNAHVFALSDDDARSFKTMAFTFLLLQNAVGKWYPRHGMMLFDVTVKSHFLAHMALNAHHLNPRLGYCFQGEDYMGKMKRISAMSAKGNNVYLMSHKTVAKYCRGLQLVLEGCS